MDLQWRIRLIDRMIKNNIDATIKDYYSIVDKEMENEVKQDARGSIIVHNVEKKSVANAITTLDNKIKEIECSLNKEVKYMAPRKRRSIPRLKRNWIV